MQTHLEKSQCNSKSRLPAYSLIKNTLETIKYQDRFPAWRKYYAGNMRAAK
jgi:hypothetical protein